MNKNINDKSRVRRQTMRPLAAVAREYDLSLIHI